MSWILRAAAAAVAGAALCASASAETRQLRIALQLPTASHLYENLDLFKTLVESGTNGALTIVIADSGQLVKEQDAPAAVGSGTIEMSTVSVVHYDKASPAVSLYVEPFMFSSPDVLAAATRPGSSLRSFVDQVILEKAAARVLWWQTAGSTVIVAKGAPLTTPAAMKGMKVRANGESEAEFIRLCGGIPHLIPAAAQYDAYKTHQVSAGSTALHSIASRKLWEVVRSASLTRHRTSEFVVTINEDLWQALSADQRRVIENAAREAERTMRARMETLERETVTLARKHDMKLVELTAEELKLWKDCATPMLEAYLQRSGGLGKRMMDAYRKVLTETYKTPAPLGSQRRTVH